MRQIDMSPAAVTARLRLVSELRRLCLSLGKAKVNARSDSAREDEKAKKEVQKKSK